MKQHIFTYELEACPNKSRNNLKRDINYVYRKFTENRDESNVVNCFINEFRND